MTLGKTVEKVGFEKIFEIVGGHGRYQWILLWVASLQLIFLTWNHLGYIFIGAVPQHWCEVEDLSGRTNWTQEQLRELAIPKIPNENGLVTHEMKFDSCHYYANDWKELLVRHNGDYNAILQMTRKLQAEGTVVKQKCQKWVYDDSIYHSTIVTEFNLVCDRRYLTATIQATYMIGGTFGTAAFGVLNDRFLGRRKSALISIVFVLVGGFTSVFSTSYWLFVSIRLLIAIGTSGCMQAANILLLEYCDIGSRAKIYNIAGAFFGVGYALMPIYAYFIRDWSMLQLAFSSTTLLLLSYYWILPESPRWLASMGKEKEAVGALTKVAKINKRPEPDEVHLKSLILSCRKQSEEDEGTVLGQICGIGRNIKALVDTPEGCKRTLTVWTLFILVAFIYYGMAFSTNLTSNPYLLVTIGGLMEIPACILPIPFLSKWGRRPTTAICYLLTGVFLFCIAITPPEYEMARVVFTMLGKFFIAAAFTVLYLVVSEVYPTLIRSTGQSSGTIMGRIGSIAAPYAADLLTTVYPDLPCLIFAILSVIGAGIALLLPEMKGLEMMDHVSELELNHL